MWLIPLSGSKQSTHHIILQSGPWRHLPATNNMAVQTRKIGPAMRKFAFKWVSLVLIVYCLLYSVHLTLQPSVQGPMASLCGTVYTFFSYWLQVCHEQASRLETWRYLSSVELFEVVQPQSVCPLTCPMDQERGLCGCLVARAEIGDSTRGYSTPPFPFNMLPGRVETSCQDFTGYALERCTADVRTRTQLFIALTVIFSMVFFCVVLISILTCIRRVKARRTVHSAITTRKTPKKRPRTLISGGNRRSNRGLGDRPHERDTSPRQSLNDDDAVEAEEQGIADQDIPVTLDGMTDGWMHWIRQRANMVRMFVCIKGNDTNPLFSSIYHATLHLERREVIDLLLAPLALPRVVHHAFHLSNYLNRHCLLSAKSAVLTLVQHGLQVKERKERVREGSLSGSGGTGPSDAVGNITRRLCITAFIFCSPIRQFKPLGTQLVLFRPCSLSLLVWGTNQVVQEFSRLGILSGIRFWLFFLLGPVL